MKALRRALLALGVAGVLGWIVRTRGRGGVPPSKGGWRQLREPDFR